MADWSTCPHCQLKHTTRADGLCPRCRQPVSDGAPFAVPAEPLPAPAAPPTAAGTVYGGGGGTVYGGGGGTVYGGGPTGSPGPPSRYSPPPPAPGKSGAVKGILATVVTLVILAGLRTLGSSGGSGFVFKYMYGLGDQPVTQVQGEAVPYKLTLPVAHQWFLRSAESAQRDNADADRWLVCPAKNAHVLVIVEDVALGKDQYIDMDKLVNLVIDNTRSALKDYVVHTKHHISRPIGGRLIHGTAHVEGLDVELYHGVFIDGHRVYQVLAFAEKKNFPEMKEELNGIISTMRLAA